MSFPVAASIVIGAIPLVFFKNEARLNEIIAACREIGVGVANPHTFVLEDLVDAAKALPFLQLVNAERLVRVDLPALGLEPGGPRRLEICAPDGDSWERWEIERFAVDGRVRLKHLDEPGRVEWRDLTQHRYRWVL